MTPPLDAWHGARCGRSSIFRERGGGGGKPPPPPPRRGAQTPEGGPRGTGEGPTACGGGGGGPGPGPRSLAGRHTRLGRGCGEWGKVPRAVGTATRRAGSVGTWGGFPGDL